MALTLARHPREPRTVGQERGSSASERLKSLDSCLTRFAVEKLLAGMTKTGAFRLSKCRSAQAPKPPLVAATVGIVSAPILQLPRSSKKQPSLAAPRVRCATLRTNGPDAVFAGWTIILLAGPADRRRQPPAPHSFSSSSDCTLRRGSPLATCGRRYCPSDCSRSALVLSAR
jgi:hypothetical protein